MRCWARGGGNLTVDAGGGGSGGSSHLPGEAGALDGLRALLDFVFVAAAVQRHHLAGARPDVMRRCGDRGGGVSPPHCNGLSYVEESTLGLVFLGD